LTGFVAGEYDARVMSAADDVERRPRAGMRCPACQGPAAWTDNPHRPFCSLACRLIDLGVWLDEGYRIDAEPLTATDEADVP
jgi:hypothetical protein